MFCKSLHLKDGVVPGHMVHRMGKDWSLRSVSHGRGYMMLCPCQWIPLLLQSNVLDQVLSPCRSLGHKQNHRLHLQSRPRSLTLLDISSVFCLSGDPVALFYCETSLGKQ